MNALSLALVVLAVAAGVALADTPKIIQGCEVKQAANGNYYNLVDATCLMAATDAGDGSSTYADFDGNTNTPETFGHIDR